MDGNKLQEVMEREQGNIPHRWRDKIFRGEIILDPFFFPSNSYPYLSPTQVSAR